jgi:hypothetical protein
VCEPPLGSTNQIIYRTRHIEPDRIADPLLRLPAAYQSGSIGRYDSQVPACTKPARPI